MAETLEGPVDTALGIVVIGRNEGQRLHRCLLSLGEHLPHTAYVDSGSTDGSVALAQRLGAMVVELDPAMPFTAARARNEGFAALQRQLPLLRHVQFVDGDCEVEPGWLVTAVQALKGEATLAVVFGRRRERSRNATPYNRLCDLEWDVPVGEVEACGGDAMMRVAAFTAVGGFDNTRIAGEEPELCLRLRAAGFRLRRLDAPMTIHDADLQRFGQWWRRAVRAGYVEAEGLAELGARYPRRRAALGNLLWALLLPCAVLCASMLLASLGYGLVAILPPLLLAGIYALQWLRIARSARRRWPPADARLYAAFCLLAKWPALQGMATYWWRRLRRRERKLIEYKGAASA
jgi:GT2 family glycosyltransferase